MEFCRYAAERRARRGLGKPETFTFLGFVFICGKSRRGAFLLRRQTRGDRVRAALQAIKSQLRVRMHDAIPDQGRWLKAVVTDYFAYHAVPTNSRALVAFRHHFLNSWRRTLERRSQKAGVTWAWMDKLAAAWLPPPRILHPWPTERFAVKHPRWEPSVNRARWDLCRALSNGCPTAIVDTRSLAQTQLAVQVIDQHRPSSTGLPRRRDAH